MQVPVPHERPVRDGRGVADQVLREPAVEHRVEEDPVADRVDPARRVGVRGGVGKGPHRVEVERERHLALRGQP
jgi:hypothetical protein